MHREILNAPEGFEVDHIDANRLNNSRKKLGKYKGVHSLPISEDFVLGVAKRSGNIQICLLGRLDALVSFPFYCCRIIMNFL
jgi:hypothetical protein